MAVIENLQRTNQDLVTGQEQERATTEAAQFELEVSKFDAQTVLQERDERIRRLEEEKAVLVQVADQARSDLEKANERWVTIGGRMDALTHGISDAAEVIKSTRDIASDIAKAQENVINSNLAQEVENTTKELQAEIKMLTDRNSSLEDQTTTMVQRHKDGQLVYAT